jgi:hypothetical protein
MIANGRFHPKGGGPAERLGKFDTNIRPGGHFENFIAAVRSRKFEDLNADVLEAHYSSALCHLANISYRLGNVANFEKAREAVGENPVVRATVAAILGLLVPVAVFCALQAHFAASPEREEGGPERPSDYFFLQRALPDGTIPSERIAQAVEELLFDRELQRQQLGTSAAQDWVPVGPYGVGGRVNAIVAARGGTPAYLGSANGGVWRSNNFGVNWTPLTDRLGIFSVGAPAIDPNNPNRVWCGTGDANGTVDGYDGTGLFLTRDGGSSWACRGLRETSHIAAVALHPSDTSRIFVGAMGKSFTTDPNRGLYRTTNAGKTWQRVLFVDEMTGASDLAMDATNPRILFAGMWPIDIKTWGRKSGGPGGGVYVSRDGGSTWAQIKGHGLPDPPLGKTAVAVAPSNPQRVYALIETGQRGSLWRSDDGGEKCRALPRTPPGSLTSSKKSSIRLRPSSEWKSTWPSAPMIANP